MQCDGGRQRQREIRGIHCVPGRTRGGRSPLSAGRVRRREIRRACPRECTSAPDDVSREAGELDARLVKASRREVVCLILFLPSRHPLRPASFSHAVASLGSPRRAAPLYRERLRASACATAKRTRSPAKHGRFFPRATLTNITSPRIPLEIIPKGTGRRTGKETLATWRDSTGQCNAKLWDVIAAYFKSFEILLNAFSIFRK